MSMVGRTIVKSGVGTVVLFGIPFAGLTWLIHHAPWPPHWAEPVLLAIVPAACIPVLAGRSTLAGWSGLAIIWALGVLLAPHADLSGEISIGHNLGMLIDEIGMIAYGSFELTPYRLARFGVSALAGVTAVSIGSWHLMFAVQRLHDLVRMGAKVRPVRVLSDAEWAATDEIKRRFSAAGGIVLGELTDPRKGRDFDPSNRESWGQQGKGRLITLDPRKGNAHSLVFSGSGSFKSAGVAIPNALTYAGPLIVIDPKGEIHDRTAGARRQMGRRPWLITAEDGLDPLKLLAALSPNDGTVYSDLAEFMLITTGEDRSDAAAFFHRKAARLLTALLAWFHDRDEGGNIPAAAYRCLARPPDVIRADFLEAADEYRHGDSDRDYISVGLAEMAHTEDRQFSSVVATVVNGLEWAGKSTTRGFVESGEMSGAELVRRALDPMTDMYIRIPTEISQSAPEIARVLIGSLVRAIRVSASASDAGEVQHRLFIIDEARALRRMDHLVSIRDEARAYGIHLMQIFQSWQQLVECYGPHGAGAWENSVDAMVIGPVQNSIQAQALSRMIGRRTVVTSSSSRQRSSQVFMPFSGSAGSAVSKQLRETELIQPSELRKLPPEAAIILATGTAPILASKAIWFTRNEMAEQVAAAGGGTDGPGSSFDQGSRSEPESHAEDSPADSGDAFDASQSEFETDAASLDLAGRTQDQPDTAEEVETVSEECPRDADERIEVGEDRERRRDVQEDDAQRPEPDAEDADHGALGQRMQPGDASAGGRTEDESSERAIGARDDRDVGDEDAEPAPIVHQGATKESRGLALGLPDDLDSIGNDLAKLRPRSKRTRPARTATHIQTVAPDAPNLGQAIRLEPGENGKGGVSDCSIGEAGSDMVGTNGERPSSPMQTSPGPAAKAELKDRRSNGAAGNADGWTDAHQTNADASRESGAPPSQHHADRVAGGQIGRCFHRFGKVGERLLGSRRVRDSDEGDRRRQPIAKQEQGDVGDTDDGFSQSEPDSSQGDNDDAFDAIDAERVRDVKSSKPDRDLKDDDLRQLEAAIHQNTIYDMLIEKSVALDSRRNALAKQVLSQPYLAQPKGTSIGVVLPNALGPGVERPDCLSIVFIPDDGTSPIHRILVDETGSITGTAGPYRRGT